ncbi:TfoX/Sxy family protein [Desulfotomaculum sp. 1211_IL3151]|uniref:TfoX/Sxy family protein n=1 Tax=Desulfotomaculum sp. 1211_IL3151 TaxID=3084055 RepID=UPI002FD9EC73
MGNLAKLPNIGEVVEQQLNEVGITTYEQLREVGSKQAWLKIKAIDPSACIHRLYAFEGAIQGIKKSQLPAGTKAELKDFYNSFKG